jgi:hypothetical protein
MSSARDLREDAPSAPPASGKRLIQPWKTLDLKKVEGPVHVPVREHAKVPQRTDYVGLVMSALVVFVGTFGPAAMLVRFVHRSAGWDLVARVSYLLEDSLTCSVSSLVALAAAITLAIMSTYARPRSYGYLLASLGTLVVGVTLACIAVASAPLSRLTMIAWALPVAPLGIALRLMRKAWARAFECAPARGFVLAAVAVSLGFAAVELWLGAGLGASIH